MDRKTMKSYCSQVGYFYILTYKTVHIVFSVVSKQII